MKIILFLMVAVTCLDLFAQETILYKETSILNIVERSKPPVYNPRKRSYSYQSNKIRRGSRAHARVVFLDKRINKVEVNEIKRSHYRFLLERFGVNNESLKDIKALFNELDLYLGKAELTANNFNYSTLTYEYSLDCEDKVIIFEKKSHHNLEHEIEYKISIIKL